jgi:hypothetical protein
VESGNDDSERRHRRGCTGLLSKIEVKMTYISTGGVHEKQRGRLRSVTFPAATGKELNAAVNNIDMYLELSNGRPPSRDAN